jgi:ATP-dependent Clp protease ATP-binding subunit ClpB
MADEGSEQALIKIAVMAEVKQHFRPEFVNRIDEIVVFSPLDQANIASIARIQLKGLEERLRKLEIKLDVTDEALEGPSRRRGFDPVYGARPLKRAIQQQIENPLAKEILAGHYGPGDTVHVREQRGEIVFTKA